MNRTSELWFMEDGIKEEMRKRTAILKRSLKEAETLYKYDAYDAYAIAMEDVARNADALSELVQKMKETVRQY